MKLLTIMAALAASLSAQTYTWMGDLGATNVQAGDITRLSGGQPFPYATLDYSETATCGYYRGLGSPGLFEFHLAEHSRDGQTCSLLSGHQPFWFIGFAGAPTQIAGCDPDWDIFFIDPNSAVMLYPGTNPPTTSSWWGPGCAAGSGTDVNTNQVWNLGSASVGVMLVVQSCRITNNVAYFSSPLMFFVP